MYSHTLLSNTGPLIAAAVSVACTLLFCCYRWYDAKPSKAHRIDQEASREISSSLVQSISCDPKPAPPLTPSFLQTRNISRERVEAHMHGESDRKVRRGGMRRRWSGGMWEHLGTEI